MRSYSVADWCALHNFSVAFFYKLEAKGEAPATFKVGRCKRISEDANRQWMTSLQAKAAA